jgi:hypothetical protein
VTSKSKEESLRTYNGATHYNEWQFIYLATTRQPGAPGGPGAPAGGPSRGRGRGEPFDLGGRGGRGRGSLDQEPDGRRMFRLDSDPYDSGQGRPAGQGPSRGFGFPPSDREFRFPQQAPPQPGR